MIITADRLPEKVKLCGRTFLDRAENVLYFNWTCAGAEFSFRGTSLRAEFRVMPGVIRSEKMGNRPGEKTIVETTDWPWIALIMDGGEVPFRRILLDGSRISVTLFESGQEEEHTFKIVKQTEAFRGQIGFVSLLAEGEIAPLPEKEKFIEFVGDSITCGFGNATDDGARGYCAAEQDAWMTHGAITARRLGMDASFVSVSGISLKSFFPGLYCMPELYPYADRIGQDAAAKARGEEKPDYLVYDNTARVPDYIVLNLGTNDSTGIRFSADPDKTEQEFEDDYYGFIRMLREKNGKIPRLICAAGSIDYYYYDRIINAVNRYRAETGDDRIYTMKYSKMLMMGPDVGAAFHPSIAKHEKMAEELIRFIEKIS